MPFVGSLAIALVDIGLGKLERVFDEIELRLSLLDDDLHDIEAEQNIRLIEHSQPFQRAARDEFLLGERHRLAGRAVGIALPRLDFHEGQDTARAIPAHEIHFATVRSAKIPMEDLVPLPAKIASRQALAHPAQPNIGVLSRIRRRGKSSAKQARKISDESDKVHGPGD